MPLSDRFFYAFLVALDNLGERDYFSEKAPSECADGHGYYWDAAKVRRALTEQMGPVTWPLDDSEVSALSDERAIEYVQAFFQFVSAPTDSWFHSYCNSSHPTAWDCARGRYDYTVTVNGLLDRFDTGYRMQGGIVQSTGSVVLTPRLADPLPFGQDRHLALLLSSALTKFGSPSHQSRWEGLRLLADAYERIKTLQDPDKKTSVGLLVKALSPEAKIAQHLDALLREVTSFSNDLSIRHHEVGITEITEDADLIDFLFYTYYNVIRLSLLRLFPAG